jgi:hypothetical protein
MPQTPSTKPVRLGTLEQFAIGISSGMLAASGLSTVRWILVVIVLPIMALELWDLVQLTFCQPDPDTMKQLKNLRMQQFGYGVISGSAMSNLVSDLILRPSIYTVLDFIIYLCLTLAWSTFWSLPSLLDLAHSMDGMTAKLETALESKKGDTKKRSRKPLSRKHSKLISLPMGDSAVRSTPRQKVRVASCA